MSTDVAVSVAVKLDADERGPRLISLMRIAPLAEDYLRDQELPIIDYPDAVSTPRFMTTRSEMSLSVLSKL